MNPVLKVTHVTTYVHRWVVLRVVLHCVLVQRLAPLRLWILESPSDLVTH